MERWLVPAHLEIEEINTPLPKADHHFGDVLQDCRPFHFTSPLPLPLCSAFWLSVQFSSVTELQYSRPPCPSPTAGVHPNPCPSSWWCHPAISSSVIPFSSCPQSFPALGSFPMSQLFAWGRQSTGVSALASFLPKNTQGWSPLEWTYDLNQTPYDYTVEVRNKFKIQACCFFFFPFSSVRYSPIAQSCPTLYDPMNCSMPGLSVH